MSKSQGASSKDKHVVAAVGKEGRPPIPWGPFEFHELWGGSPKVWTGYSAHCDRHGKCDKRGNYSCRTSLSFNKSMPAAETLLRLKRWLVQGLLSFKDYNEDARVDHIFGLRAARCVENPPPADMKKLQDAKRAVGYF